MGENVKRHLSQIPGALLDFCLSRNHNVDVGFRSGVLNPPFNLPRNDWFV